LVVSVSDTGIGISNQDRERVFTIFGRLHETSKAHTTGMGISLGICKEIVEALGGRIFIED
jgi:signal transduction histidine kinase